MLHFPDSENDIVEIAFDLYLYGQQRDNENDKNSLRRIARSTNRDAVPVFSAFRRYFNGDDYYADTMIVRAHLIFVLLYFRSL
jgi:hypothetical protein